MIKSHPGLKPLEEVDSEMSELIAQEQRRQACAPRPKPSFVERGGRARRIGTRRRAVFPVTTSARWRDGARSAARRRRGGAWARRRERVSIRKAPLSLAQRFFRTRSACLAPLLLGDELGHFPIDLLEGF